MLKSGLRIYSDACIVVNEPVSVASTAIDAATNKNGKKAIFKKCAQLTDCKNDKWNKQYTSS